MFLQYIALVTCLRYIVTVWFSFSQHGVFRYKVLYNTIPMFPRLSKVYGVNFAVFYNGRLYFVYNSVDDLYSIHGYNSTSKDLITFFSVNDETKLSPYIIIMTNGTFDIF